MEFYRESDNWAIPALAKQATIEDSLGAEGCILLRINNVCANYGWEECIFGVWNSVLVSHEGSGEMRG